MRETSFDEVVIAAVFRAGFAQAGRCRRLDWSHVDGCRLCRLLTACKAMENASDSTFERRSGHLDVGGRAFQFAGQAGAKHLKFPG